MTDNELIELAAKAAEIGRQNEIMSNLLQRREAHLLAIKYITARMDALDAGDRKYNGSPCRNGHTSGLRYTLSDCCIECMMERPSYVKNKDSTA